LCRFLPAAEADLCAVKLDKLTYLDLRQYTLFYSSSSILYIPVQYFSYSGGFIDAFYVKTQRNEALNIELMDRNSQYTFMYVK
jgi:hypothetical protein